MRHRQTVIAVAFVGILGLFGAACSSDGDEAADTSTETSVDAAADEGAVDREPVTVDDDEFDALVDDIQSSVGGDDPEFCQVMSTLLAGPDVVPSTTAQVEAAVDTIVLVLEQLSRVAPIEEAQRVALADAAVAFRAAAQDSGYSVEFLVNEDGIAAEQTGVTAALASVMPAASQQCDPEQFGGLGGPGGTPAELNPDSE